VRQHVDLGIFAETGKPFRADLGIILRSNVLVQANSGGGKSWLLRRFIEQAFKRVPQIIIDPEGEFSTLRSHFDVVLVGKGGDTPADIRSAKLLAHRLLELGTSAVIDLFEMSKPQRPVWVAAFLSALIDAPKKLWRDFLIYIDEAHEFAPEPGHGTESRDEKACRHALIDLASKGRKRGYGVIAATQRLGKLSKDFAAELKNVLIGQTFIDIDRERAAGNLGISKANKPEFFKSVMKLEPGAFFAFGRALALEPTLVTIGDVQTEHPEAGRRQSAPPPPTDKIRHLLPQLADLPKEAEEKLVTEKELRGRIAELEREVAKKPGSLAAVAPTKTVEKAVLKEADIKRIEKLATRLEEGQQKFVDKLTDLQFKFRDESAIAQSNWGAAHASLSERLGELVQVCKPAQALRLPEGRKPAIAHVAPPRQIRNEAPGRRASDSDDESSNGALPEKSQRMLGALLQGEAMGMTSMPFKNVAHIAGVSPTSGTTANRKRALVQGGYATANGPNLQITEAGRAYPLTVSMPPTDKAGLLAYWKSEIRTEKVCAMLDFVVTNGSATDEQLSEASDMKLGTGAFANYKRELTGRGLMARVGGKGGPYEPAEAFRR
jgi:Helicase HerA, central domain